MALARFTKPVDGTIPIQALLYPDEELISSQDGVGIYDGLQKSPEHQNGTVHITNHRLFYIDASKKTSSRSFAMDLEHVSQTDYYAGLFTSSSKVTLHLHVENTEVIAAERAGISGFESWECEVCAYRNPPGLSPSAAKICGLCGVPRNSTAAGSSSVIISTSLPSSVSTSAIPLTDTSDRKPSSVPCPACTFLNHSSMKTCEICDTPLPRTTSSTSAVAAGIGTTKSAPATRPQHPD
ncbi:hypothetical protein D9757_008655 [Collybiopsis confluens]|uniref:Vacuolar protein-sorting-associated protein 36 n=1 Tax=Collybiopsis confluens TaxID=2823264 RepID=A0A8H5M0R1_9AGAR|nr:hypothetical protein D9757_008655 [Collybiopsis confluens]